MPNPSLPASTCALGKVVSVFLFSAFAFSTHAITVISQWTFENSQPTTFGPHTAEAGVNPGSALGFHAGAAVYSNPLGNGSDESFSSTIWAVGDYWQFQVGTFGYEGITLSWDQTSSSTGPRDFALSWSLTGLVGSFTQIGADYSVLPNAAPNPVWSSSTHHPEYTFTRDLASITALDNTAFVYFRLVDRTTTSAGGGTVAGGGTDRVDNFTVSGTAIPTSVPETLPLGFVAIAVLGLLLASRRFVLQPSSALSASIPSQKSEIRISKSETPVQKPCKNGAKSAQPSVRDPLRAGRVG